MIDREQLLDELARVFARAAVDRLLAQDSSTPKTVTPATTANGAGVFIDGINREIGDENGNAPPPVHAS